MADKIKIKACTGDGCVGKIYFNPIDHTATGSWTPFDAISHQKHSHYTSDANAPAPGQAPSGLEFDTTQTKIDGGTPVSEDEAIAFAEKCVKSYITACVGDGSEGEAQGRPDNCNTVYNTAIMQKMRK